MSIAPSLRANLHTPSLRANSDTPSFCATLHTPSFCAKSQNLALSPPQTIDAAPTKDQRGAGTALMAAVTLITAMVAFICACLITWFGCMHQARSAADLAALAGADAISAGREPCAVAKTTATSNKAKMTACTVDSNGVDFIVRVTVQVDAKPRLAMGPHQFTQTSQAGNA